MPAGPGAPGPPTVTAAALRAAVAGGRRPDDLGPAAGTPLLVVTVDDGPDPLAAAPLPCLVVGVAAGDPPPGAWAGADILLADAPSPPGPWVSGPGRWLPSVTAAVARSPLATVALAQLLRLGAGLAVADGLVAESFAYSMLQAGPEHRRWLAGRAPARRHHDEGPAVRVARDGPRLSVTLDRPRRHNAYGSAMRDGLVSALTVATADPTVESVELSGAGPSFCSGGDLAEFGTAPDPATAHAVRVAAGAAAWMHRCGPRTTARVHGACIGAGVELAAFASRVVAAPDAWFRLPEVSMGLVPGAGGTVSVPLRVGRHRAALLAVTGATIDATTALDWGLVDSVDPAAGAA